METKETKEKRRYRILSINGGGIRGLIPAKILEDIEEKALGKKKCSEFFDLVVGTSTGGIIAAAIAGEVPMNSVVNLFNDEFDSKTPKIFVPADSRGFLRYIMRPYEVISEFFLRFGVNTNIAIYPKYSNKALGE